MAKKEITENEVQKLNLDDLIARYIFNGREIFHLDKKFGQNVATEEEWLQILEDENLEIRKNQ